MFNRWLPLSKEQDRVLTALLQGAQLKAHRYLDGRKVHKLHNSETGQEEVIADVIVEGLSRRSLIRSNLKFPAATYVLTEKAVEQGSILVLQKG